MALADAGADACCGGVSASSAVARRACLNRWRKRFMGQDGIATDKDSTLYICVVTRRSERLGSIENGYSQCENALMAGLLYFHKIDARRLKSPRCNSQKCAHRKETVRPKALPTCTQINLGSKPSGWQMCSPHYHSISIMPIISQLIGRQPPGATCAPCEWILLEIISFQRWKIFSRIADNNHKYNQLFTNTNDSELATRIFRVEIIQDQHSGDYAQLVLGSDSKQSAKIQDHVIEYRIIEVYK